MTQRFRFFHRDDFCFRYYYFPLAFWHLTGRDHLMWNKFIERTKKNLRGSGRRPFVVAIPIRSSSRCILCDVSFVDIFLAFLVFPGPWMLFSTEV